ADASGGQRRLPEHFGVAGSACVPSRKRTTSEDRALAGLGSDRNSGDHDACSVVIVWWFGGRADLFFQEPQDAARVCRGGPDGRGGAGWDFAFVGGRGDAVRSAGTTGG